MSGVAFGLDLSGFSNNRTRLCKVVRKERGPILATLLPWPCSLPLKLRSAAHRVIEQEAKQLKECLDLGRVAVDVPIDLQHLLEPRRAHQLWELTQRPVDRAFGGLPPLADKIGAPVARFRAMLTMLRHLAHDNASELSTGRGLFETYPAASLQLLGIGSIRYKQQQAVFSGGSWQSMDGSGLAVLANELRFAAPEGTRLDDDDLDALICALTALLPECCLPKDELMAWVLDRVGREIGAAPVPSGYVLLSKLPDAPVMIAAKSSELGH